MHSTNYMQLHHVYSYAMHIMIWRNDIVITSMNCTMFRKCTIILT